MSLRFTKADELIIKQHRYLRPDDECYYLREYTIRGGFRISETNDLIHNFKREVKHRNKAPWRYKLEAIDQIAREFRDAFNRQWLEQATLIPVPPSKAKNDPEYDDRIVMLIKRICTGISGYDLREIIYQKGTRPPAHGSSHRPTPEDLVANYAVNRSLLSPPPKVIGVFDDVLVNGTNFRAMKKVLAGHFPGVRIIGFFIARGVHLDNHADGG